MNKQDKFFAEERRQQIFEIMEKERRATITELAKKFDIGEATIRRDLEALEKRGLVQRTFGGAILADSTLNEIAFADRLGHFSEEKRQIAQYVSSIIHNGDAVMIDNGSTTFAVAKELKKKSNLAVITNSPNVAAEIALSKKNKIFLCGGELYTETNSLVGPLAVKTLSQLRADYVILGMSGIVPNEGFFTVNQYEAEIKRHMMQYGEKVIVVADSSKFNKPLFSLVAEIKMVDLIVTNKSLGDEPRKQIEDQGVELVLV